MGAFFKGWKRKMGIMTLAMACLLMAAWVRSLVVTDILSPGMTNQKVRLVSVDRSLAVVLVAHENQVVTFPFWGTEAPESLDADGIPFEWTWQWYGFRYSSQRDRTTVEIWVFPDWAIVTPLILLSAWLLLSKPRRTKEPATPQRPESDHA